MIAQTFDILNAGPRSRFTVNGRVVHNSTGEGPQPTNLPKAGPNAYRCQCGRYFGTHRFGCPHCGALRALDATPAEWSPSVAEDALRVISTRSLQFVEAVYGDAMHAVAGCLRSLFDAAPGHDLVGTDYNSIEAVGLAMVSGEKWRVDVFRGDGKIYERSAAAAFRTPYEAFADHKKRTGQHHPLRQKGKVMELACLAPDVLVLTRRGAVPLLQVHCDDQLWDGVEWTSHGGLLNRGRRQVINLWGARMTADHQVLCGRSWATAGMLESDERLGCLALLTGMAMSLTVAGRAMRRANLPPGEPQGECDVYDIADAGPRNRFTILTREGTLIVHNCGYQGWLGAARAFDMPGTDDEVKADILAWRAASPAVEWLWGGQTLGKALGVWQNASAADYTGEVDPRLAPIMAGATEGRWDRTEFMFGVEGTAVRAVLKPGPWIPVTRLDGYDSGVAFRSDTNAIYCRLPSGRVLTYHNPQVVRGERGDWSLSYEGNNTNPKNGPVGWIRMSTWGGRLVENIIQATCRDILRGACIVLEEAGYPVVLHVYDEIVAEILKGWGSVEEFERLVTTEVQRRWPWCSDWPIRAPEGFRAKRYGKR